MCRRWLIWERGEMRKLDFFVWQNRYFKRSCQTRCHDEFLHFNPLKNVIYFFLFIYICFLKQVNVFKKMKKNEQQWPAVFCICVCSVANLAVGRSSGYSTVSPKNWAKGHKKMTWQSAINSAWLDLLLWLFNLLKGESNNHGWTHSDAVHSPGHFIKKTPPL